jgi:hypothetical protein
MTLITVIVGAPGSGKTTIAPYLACLSRLAEMRGLPINEIVAIMSDFVRQYLDAGIEQQRALLSSFLQRYSLGDDDSINLNHFREVYVSETGDYQGYQNHCGEIDRAKTPAANAYMLRNAIENKANVIVSGTGFSLYRIIPLLELKPDLMINIVIPDVQRRGFFNNTLSKALSVRSGHEGRKNCRYVEPDILAQLYEKQIKYLEEGGYWFELKGLHTASELLKKINRHNLSGSDLAELNEIRLNFEHFQKVTHQIGKVGEDLADAHSIIVKAWA